MVSGESKLRHWTESKSSGSPKVCFSMPKASISNSIIQKYQVHHVILLQYKPNDIMSKKDRSRHAMQIYSPFLLLSYCSYVLKEILFLERFFFLSFFSNNLFSIKRFISNYPVRIFIAQCCRIRAALTVVQAVIQITHCYCFHSNSLHGKHPP